MGTSHAGDMPGIMRRSSFLIDNLLLNRRLQLIALCLPVDLFNLLNVHVLNSTNFWIFKPLLVTALSQARRQLADGRRFLFHNKGRRSIQLVRKFSRCGELRGSLGEGVEVRRNEVLCKKRHAASFS